MVSSAFLLIMVFLIILMALARPLGKGLGVLIDDKPVPGFAAIESGLWSLCGIGQNKMNWLGYLVALLIFSLFGLVLLAAILMLQGGLPLNPQHLPGLSWDLAFNTAVSFVTNTDWQAYSGETAVSYFSQMAGLTVQNFLSAATGMAVAFALIRGLTNRSFAELGNAWRDIWRSTIYVLLPISFIMALFFISQGVIQNFNDYSIVATLEGVKQTLPMGPLATQEAIKMLGTNGGGFFNANSAHPFENPTALTNFIQMLSIFLIPAALCFAFGDAVRDRRQGHMLLWTMTLMFVAAVVVVIWAEVQGNPHFLSLGADSAMNMEGKETRFGILNSSFFAVVTTAASCGAVNAMHDSLTALGGLMPMWLIQLGEVVFGGVGSGFYGMLMFVFLAVFIAGLMIGRSPEYLGKKVETAEIKMTVIALLVTPALALLGTALAMMTNAGRGAMLNPGPHGFSEVLYAVSSAANNNGSAFAGLSANTPFYNVLLGLVMLLGRFGTLAPVIVIAGTMALKKIQPAGNGTLPTYGGLFVSLVIGSVLLMGALNFIPALALGPVAEHLKLISH